jgi:hypothetical protein
MEFARNTASKGRHHGAASVILAVREAGYPDAERVLLNRGCMEWLYAILDRAKMAKV